MNIVYFKTFRLIIYLKKAGYWIFQDLSEDMLIPKHFADM